MKRTWLVALFVSLSFAGSVSAQEELYQFTEIAEQGFGDRQNTKAWSMVWWKGHLYVGTARAHLCMNWAGLAILRERWEYPPRSFVDEGGTDPDLECTPDFRDLPLQAEIWRYAPTTDVWTRVFQSELITNPADPTRETARDIGFRNLIPFVDPDGTEALYAAGITSESINPGMPPPRLLRTTDGVNWAPVPQDPGTVFGDLGRRNANLRGAAVFKGRMYIVAGNLQGTGPLLEAANPAGGNDEFRFVTSEDLQIFELTEYNGSLYLGLGTLDGYEVMKTDAEGPGLLELTPVVPTAGGIGYFVSKGVASMHVSHGRLYVGTDKPAELIRINPDDSWDLIVGRPRNKLRDRIDPLSGMTTGFDYLYVNHFHRMTTFQNQLLLSTNDSTGFMKIYRAGQRFLPFMGFDLYVSPNGVEFSPITLTGLDSPFDIVMRVWEPTPHGLFGGTSNPWYGLKMYRVDSLAAGLAPPENLNSESVDATAVLTWKAVPGATGYRVYRRSVRDSLEFVEIGTTANTYFVDPISAGRTTFHYYVVAEADGCCTSPPSNLARWPALLKPMTIRRLGEAVTKWNGGTPPADIGAVLDETKTLLRVGDVENARALLSSLDPDASPPEGPAAAGQTALRSAALSRMRAGDLRGALQLILRARRLRAGGAQSTSLPDWRAEDLDLFLGRLMLRFQLVENGILTPQDLR